MTSGTPLCLCPRRPHSGHGSRLGGAGRHGTKRPEIKLPKSLQVDFTDWSNSDPKLRAIMDDGKALLLSSYAAICEGDPAAPTPSPSTARATRCGPEPSGSRASKGFTEKNLVLIGRARGFQPQARVSPDGGRLLARPPHSFPGSRLGRRGRAPNWSHSTLQEQEKKLREALRSFPADRRGYIKVSPESYPDLTPQRAARIAWESGLRAEAVGNRGSWRFGETVVEEVPHE
ncbi:hypothetical protein ACH4TS_27845 [Streptomyces albidoflavus]